ncbi:MAG: fructokinase [Candidatus Angelobacter sp. Gp1-AA117]|nr:MAG: fructokinase [Candidatus Angelobacter sp. Gp1-AA117]
MVNSHAAVAELGAIEAGGTKFACAVGTPAGHLIHETTIPTTTPEETLKQVIEFLRSHSRNLAAVGIGSFGPLQLNPGSAKYGYITSTPKPGWSNFDLAGTIRNAFHVPVILDTDVNAAALAESRWGAAQGLRTFLYGTVGTGIGGGAIVEGAILHGRTHPEMGHIRVPHDRSRDPFPGTCPYHENCLEGLASGTALEARWKVSPATLPRNHPAWVLEAEYLALACVNWMCTLSPQRVILGGGVMQQKQLFPLICERVARLMNTYMDTSESADNLGSFIVPSPLAGNAGLLGALALANCHTASGNSS